MRRRKSHTGGQARFLPHGRRGNTPIQVPTEITCSLFRRTERPHAIIPAIILSAVTLGGCGDSDSPSTPAPSAYQGSWAVVFAGSYTGGGNITIDADGDCSATILLSDGVNSFTNLITFSVASNGSISNGLVYYAGAPIGTVSGTFSASAGSGAYQTSQPSSGTWAATKN